MKVLALILCFGTGCAHLRHRSACRLHQKLSADTFRLNSGRKNLSSLHFLGRPFVFASLDGIPVSSDTSGANVPKMECSFYSKWIEKNFKPPLAQFIHSILDSYYRTCTPLNILIRFTLSKGQPWRQTIFRQISPM